MGQAKMRGSEQERIDQAQQKVKDLRPSAIECVHCKTSVTELVDLEPPKSAGLTAAFSGVCLHCGLLNYAIFGPAENVREAYRKLALDKLERYKSRRPDPIACDTCATMLENVMELPTEGMSGLLSAHAAFCTACQEPTYALKGTPEGVSFVRARLLQAGFMRQ